MRIKDCVWLCTYMKYVVKCISIFNTFSVFSIVTIDPITKKRLCRSLLVIIYIKFFSSGCYLLKGHCSYRYNLFKKNIDIFLYKSVSWENGFVDKSICLLALWWIVKVVSKLFDNWYFHPIQNVSYIILQWYLK